MTVLLRTPFSAGQGGRAVNVLKVCSARAALRPAQNAWLHLKHLPLDGDLRDLAQQEGVQGLPKEAPHSCSTGFKAFQVCLGSSPGNGLHFPATEEESPLSPSKCPSSEIKGSWGSPGVGRPPNGPSDVQNRTVWTWTMAHCSSPAGQTEKKGRRPDPGLFAEKVTRPKANANFYCNRPCTRSTLQHGESSPATCLRQALATASGSLCKGQTTQACVATPASCT